MGVSIDFVAPGSDEFKDEYSHGTSVASIIAGKTAGVAPGVTIHNFRVLDEDGNAAWATVADALAYLIHEQHALNSTRPKTVIASM